MRIKELKWRYVLLCVLALSLVANFIFIPSFLHLRRASHQVSSINNYIGATVHDANVNLQKYDKTHSAAALGDAAMELLSASGQLEQYSLITQDGVTNEFGMMLGNLGADLVLKKNITENSQIVSRIASQLPDTAATIAKIEGSQIELDNRLEVILNQFPPARYNLY